MVDTLSDVVDANDGFTSLREAVIDANVTEGDNIIKFAPWLTAAAPATIVLTQGELTLLDALTIAGPGADRLILDASGSDPTPNSDMGDGSRVFNVDDGQESKVNVTIQGLGVTGGDEVSGGGIFSRERLTLIACTITGNSAAIVSGGGIANYSGELSIADSIISGNVAGYDGGGVYSRFGNVRVESSSIRENVSHNAGGIHCETGELLLLDSVVSQNRAYAFGGGIFNFNGSADIRYTTIDDNEAEHGGGIFMNNSTVKLTDCVVVGNESESEGGGIAAVGTTPDLNQLMLSDCDIRDNVATFGEGGGVSIRDGKLTAVETNFQNNTARFRFGGGISGQRSSLAFADCSISGNHSENGGGGGIAAYAGTLSLSRSSISGNSSDDWGGGLLGGGTETTIVGSEVSRNQSLKNGGGICLRGAKLLLRNSTVDNNTAGWNGGGIYGWRNSLDVNSSTITGNQADMGGGGLYLRAYSSESTAAIKYSTLVRNMANADANGGNDRGGGMYLSQSGNVVLELSHSIAAENFVDGPASIAEDVVGPVQAYFCLLGVDSSPQWVNVAGSISGTLASPLDPRLGPLVSNGGPTRTHAALPGSPAIDAGDAAAAAGANGTPEFDQRGEPWSRVAGGRIDIGAVEAQANPLAGDYNFDGAVDAADYSVWRDTLGSTNDLRADGSGPTVGLPDGVVDERDNAFWKLNFGNVLDAEGGGASFAALKSQVVVVDEVPAPASISTSALSGELRLAGEAEGPLGKSARRCSPAIGRTSAAAASDFDGALVAWLSQVRSRNLLQTAPTEDVVASANDSSDSHEIDAFDSAFAALGSAACRRGL